MSISDGFSHLEMSKEPVWSDTKNEGNMIFKVSIPKFLEGNLFTLEKYIGKEVKFTLVAHSYDNDQFGTGYYLRLSSEITLL